MRLSRNTVHVIISTPRKDGRVWAVITGSSKYRRYFKTKVEAITRGRQLAKRKKAELFIHGSDGQIQRKDSYGADSFPPKG